MCAAPGLLRLLFSTLMSAIAWSCQRAASTAEPGIAAMKEKGRSATGQKVRDGRPRESEVGRRVQFDEKACTFHSESELFWFRWLTILIYYLMALLLFMCRRLLSRHSLSAFIVSVTVCYGGGVTVTVTVSRVSNPASRQARRAAASVVPLHAHGRL